ncbi:MAG: 50S ribosomal protein L2 [Candidatus Nanoarchaeia archaeon]
MGKRIIQQARGKGSLTYRVRNRAFKTKIGYPLQLSEEYEIVKLFTTSGNSAPLAKMRDKQGNVFVCIAGNNMYEGQKIKGEIAELKDIENGKEIFNIECKPKDGGKLIRAGGGAGIILNKKNGKVVVLMPSKKEKEFNANCRATIGRVGGEGRINKPILKAGKKYHIMKAKSKLWPRTSAVKMNAIDHPFGSGRGKNPKSKIVKRMAPSGRKVGLLRPKRTGRKKR